MPSFKKIYLSILLNSNPLYVILPKVNHFPFINSDKLFTTMKATVLIRLTLIILSTIFLLSCNDSESGCEDILADVICTEQFVSLRVTVKDKNGIPITLDRFEVINMENNVDIALHYNTGSIYIPRCGQYPLASDGDVAYNENLHLIFKGYLDDQTVVEINYIVSADCCHIFLVSGNLEIIV